MSEQDYSQFLFEKHDQDKFDKYEELVDCKGFKLPNDKNQTKYLLDEDEGWCDLNGCYYNSLGQPSGWIILSKDGKKYMRFNQNREFIEEQENKYYQNEQFNVTHLVQNQQKQKNLNDQEQQQQKQQSKQENRKQQNQSNQSNQKNQDNQRKQKYNKQKDQEHEKAKIQDISEKDQEQDQEEDLYVEKIDQQLPKEPKNTNDDPKTNDQEGRQRNQRDRKQNDRNRKKQNKDDQNNNNQESKKYYILNINENSLSKEDFIKFLIEECKIKEKSIIEYNENILKLALEKDAIKLYRLNRKQQTDKVQKFIVST
ncbi:unnamed protein product [Paramecium primaurelia]|uniref:Uncharacterized protein n=1 Tax=Paramecium primaurelia TaxID=5886 RepID=A0A8S1KBI9_PARPR|nr:unnamed protein product [Paramecium primaurelia]